MRVGLMASLLIAAVAAAEPTHHLDVDQTLLLLRTHKDGLASGFAHNHVIRAVDFSGDLSWDEAHPEATAMAITVQVGALAVDEQKIRATPGADFSSAISPEDRQKVRRNMLDEGQLDAKKFPTIAFRSTSVKPGRSFASGEPEKGTATLQVFGKLTLHGVTKEVSFPAKVTTTGTTVTGDAHFTFKTSDYGISPYSAALGTIKNRDEVELVLHLVGAP